MKRFLLRINRTGWVIIILLGLLLSAAMATVLAQSGGNFELTHTSLGGNWPNVATGGSFELGGNIGQATVGDPVKGKMRGVEFSLTGGFWTAAVDDVPPEVTAELAPEEGQKIEQEEGVFRVAYSCSDRFDTTPVIIAAAINGIPVNIGQLVRLEISKEQDVAEVDGVLEIEARSFLLTVQCQDDAENLGTATAEPQFAAKRKGKDKS